MPHTQLPPLPPRDDDGFPIPPSRGAAGTVSVPASRNVRDYGAKGDGKSVDTAAIQAAINAGGTVYFPPGIYVTGTLQLRSNGGLLLDQGAVLQASTNPADYERPELFPQEERNLPGPGNHAHLIIACEADHIFIRGGRIDGNGRFFFAGAETHENFTGGTMLCQVPWRMQQMLYFCECTHVRISDTALTDATCWSCFLHGCEYVHVDNVNIFTNPMIGEDDGLDIDSCRFVTVSNCVIDVGDDALTLRGNPAKLKNARVCEWITVTNCILHSAYAHAIRVGVGSGEIRHAVFSNIAVRDSHCAVHINSKYSDASEGVLISDLAFRNMHVEVDQLFFLTLDYKRVKDNPSQRAIERIVFENIDGMVRLPSQIRGNGLGDISDIALSNLRLTVAGDPNAPAWSRTKEFLIIRSAEAAFQLENCRKIDFDGVKLQYAEPNAWHLDVRRTGCPGVTAENCRFPLGLGAE